MWLFQRYRRSSLPTIDSLPPLNLNDRVVPDDELEDLPDEINHRLNLVFTLWKRYCEKRRNAIVLQKACMKIVENNILLRLEKVRKRWHIKLIEVYYA